MIITLDLDLEARLRQAAAARGVDPNRFAVAVLAEALQQQEDDADAAALTDEEWARIEAGIERGTADFDAGRFRSVDEIVADKRTRFGLDL
jgi:predicted transcriptional regulator